MKHRTAQITSPHTLIWTEADTTLPADQVAVKTLLSGVSAGTETMWFTATASALTSGRRDYPYRPGYACVGQVTEIGSQIPRDPDAYPRLSALKPGDRIFAFKPHASGANLGETDLWTMIPDDIKSEDALGLALACTSIHALHRSGMQVGDSAAVIGLGLLGFMMISCLRAAGAGQILAVSRSEAKRAHAENLGATAVMDTQTLGQNAAAHSMSDIVFECSGQSERINDALRLAAPQGKIIAAGFYNDPLQIDGEMLFAKELALYGVRASGANQPRSEFMRWPRSENLMLAREYLKRGFIRTRPLISHRIAPDALAEAYAMIANQTKPYGLIVIEW